MRGILQAVIVSALLFSSVGFAQELEVSGVKNTDQTAVSSEQAYVNLFEQMNGSIDQIALQVIESMPLAQRPTMVLGVAIETEKLWLANGWIRCNNQTLQSSDQTPFGFRVFDKENKCFYSIVENSWAWLRSFMVASVKEQAIFFATIEKVRRAFANTNNQRQNSGYKRR
jgi:hypothetical protein